MIIGAILLHAIPLRCTNRLVYLELGNDEFPRPWHIITYPY